jgi:hypothetical protein
MSAVSSSGPTPYGFAAAPSGVLVVTEAFGARVGESISPEVREELVSAFRSLLRPPAE